MQRTTSVSKTVDVMAEYFRPVSRQCIAEDKRFEESPSPAAEDGEANRYERKYLGERSDPHHQFEDPVVSRQRFTLAEEIELRRACAAALSNVPHSDEMADDPFRYLSKIISSKPAIPETIRPPLTPAASKVTTTSTHMSRPSKNVFDRKSTNSFSSVSTVSKPRSKSSTIKTESSTPFTTPGITPMKIDSHPSCVSGSESIYHPNDSSRPSTTHSGYDADKSNNFRKSQVYSFMSKPYPVNPMYAQHPTATKSLTHLPTPHADGSRPQTRSRKVLGSVTNVMSNKNFNQSLPSIAQKPDQAQLNQADSPVEKSGIMARMLKTVRLGRAQPKQKSQAQVVQINTASQHSTVEKPLESAKRSKFKVINLFHKHKVHSKTGVNAEVRNA